MSKFAKLAVFAFIVLGLSMFVSGGKVSAIQVGCPAGDVVPDNWGIQTPGEHNFASVAVHAYYYDTNGNLKQLNVKYHLRSSVDHDHGQSYGPPPPGVPSNLYPDARIFKEPVPGGGRLDEHWFQTGEQLSATPQSMPPCPGWDELGPGTEDRIGNGYVLDCQEYDTNGNIWNNHFWIDEIKTPSGAVSQYGGHWKIYVSVAGGALQYKGDTMSYSNDLEVENGENARVNLEWVPNPAPPKTFGDQGACTYASITTDNNWNGHPKRTHVQITGISLGKRINKHWNGTQWVKDSETDYSSDPAYTDPPNSGGRPLSVDANVPDDNGQTSGNTMKEWYFLPWESNTVKIIQTTQAYYDNTGDGVNNPTWNNVNGPLYYNGSGWQTTDTSVTCYTGTCNITSAYGDGPNNVVTAGGTIHVSATLTNTSRDALQLWGSQLIGTGGTQSSDAVIPSGGVAYYNFDIPAPSSVQSYGLSFYPNYPPPGGGGRIWDGTCTKSVDVYEPFQLKPYSTLTYPGTAEYPRSITYSTYVQNNSSQTIPAPSSSSFTYTPYASGTGCPNSGPVGTPSGQFAPGGPDYTISPTNCNPASYEAGDLYCSQISLTSYNNGWVGPGGELAGTNLDSNYASDQHCLRIINEPYFKVKGANVSAGGDFNTSGTGVCTGGGLLGGYDDNVDNPNRGSGSELSALALIKITGVASAQGAYSTSAPSGTALTFANTNAGDISSNYDSPNLGGNFDPGGSHCLTDQSPSSTSTSVNGPYKQPGKSNITDNESIFVTGDVRIMGNITYGSGWTIDNVPSFVLHATGNIYIDPSVTQLDGTYVSNKKVYTCDNNGFSPMPASQMYTSCRNQLEVNGSVTAQHINMQRTFGSLRDERPGGDVAPGAEVDFVWSSAGPVSGMRCTQINESADPHTWTDNYLCVPNSTDIHLAWTHHSDNPDGCAGVKFKNYVPIKGSDPGEASESCLQSNGFPSCIQWNAVGDPDTWTDNYLCANQDLGLSFNTSQIAGKYCGTNLLETADPDGKWSTTGYYLCQPQAPPTGPLCSNAGTQVDPKSCAGEIFNFSPEIFLSTPAIQLPNNGAVQYDAVTSKPPVL